jgi:hypothetical protein
MTIHPLWEYYLIMTTGIDGYIQIDEEYKTNEDYEDQNATSLYAYEMLKKITKQDFGNNFALWEEYIKNNIDHYDDMVTKMME